MHQIPPTSTKRTLLLLPSAKLIPIELQSEFGPIPPAMVPLGGRPAYTHVIAGYADQEIDVLIAAHEAAEVIERNLHHGNDASPHAVSMVDVGETGSLAETILVALDSLPEVPHDLIINFADTVVSDTIAAGTTIAWARAHNLFRWSCFTQTVEGGIDAIIERFAPKTGTPPAFVGVFRIQDVSAFRKDLRNAIDIPVPGIDPFYSALKEHYNHCPTTERTLQEVRQWWDLGHLDTYYQTKHAYWINKRFFNDLKIQRGRGVIRKESRETSKFINEIRWYLKLPKQLAYLIPRLFDYSLDAFKPWVEMEFYGYPTLNDMYLFGQHDPGFWSQVLDAITEAMDAMATFRVAPGNSETVAALTEMYHHKTRSRLLPLVENPWTAPFFADSLSINGERCHGINHVIEKISDLMKITGIDDVKFFNIIHGDFCLSNILFDARNCAIRVIDPRGSFGPWDIYGDPRYDLAKLAHSINGDYDLIVNGMVSTQWDRENFHFHPHVTPSQETVKSMFQTWLHRRVGPMGVLQVELIESLLFLSMAPLHSDRPDAQRAFLCKGLLHFWQTARAAGLEGIPS